MQNQQNHIRLPGMAQVFACLAIFLALAFSFTSGPCCTIPKQDSSLSGADFAQLTCCRTGIPNPVILLIAFTHASASPTCAL